MKDRNPKFETGARERRRGPRHALQTPIKTKNEAASTRDFPQGPPLGGSRGADNVAWVGKPQAPELEPGGDSAPLTRPDSVVRNKGIEKLRVEPAGRGNARLPAPVPQLSVLPAPSPPPTGIRGSNTALRLTHALPFLSFPGLKGARDDVGTRSRATTWVTLWKNSYTICDSRLESLIAAHSALLRLRGLQDTKNSGMCLFLGAQNRWVSPAGLKDRHSRH